MICDAFKPKHISHLLSTSSRSPWNWNIWWSWREKRKGIRRRLLADNFENWKFFPVSLRSVRFFSFTRYCFFISPPHLYSLHPSLWWKINLMNDSVLCSSLSRGVSSNYNNIVHLSLSCHMNANNFFSFVSSSFHSLSLSLIFTGN
jgi:hypothetical protein